MKLYLVRHGKALSPEVNPDRPLSPEGKSDVEQIAKFIALHTPPLASLWHSAKARGRETAEIFRKHLKPSGEKVELPYLDPNDPIEQVVERILGEVGDLMIVGHLPFLNRLLGFLLVNNEDASLVNFHEGTCVCLDLQEEKWAIEWIASRRLCL